MPGMAPSTATPDEADDREPELPTLDPVDALQIGDFEEADRGCDHDGGKRGVRQILQQVRCREEQQRHAIAPTTPVSCVLAPAASATGVREELLLIGKPWKNPAARFATPRPTISWLGSTRVRRRAA